MSTDESLKATWVSIFSRKGASGATTCLWDKCDERLRAAVLARADLAGGELPVLVSGGDAEGASLLTTRRLVHHAMTIPIERIAGIEPVDFARKPKSELNKLEVATIDGQKLRVEAEPGRPYIGLWNVLLHIATRNVRRRAIS